MKPFITQLLALVLFFTAPALRAESYPEFSRDYWQQARKSAEGKMWRGVGLGVLGLASIAPTTIFIYKATDNPEKFLAYSIVSGIATLGMTFHGFFSIRTGIKERDTADRFIQSYDDGNVSPEAERDEYLSSKKKSTIKILIFGGALVVQSAALLANGIVLGVRKKRGEDIHGIKIWPSYLLGGLLFAGGTAIIIGKGIKLHQLNALEASPASSGSAALTFEPIIQYDPATGETGFGLSSRLSF